MTLHQIPLCNELYKKLGDNFKFVSTVPMGQERIAMGWQTEQKYPYELYANDDGVKEQIDKADIVLVGSADDQIILNRLHNQKIVIHYSERILKNGRWHALSPRAIKNVVSKHTVYKKAPADWLTLILSAGIMCVLTVGIVLIFFFSKEEKADLLKLFFKKKKSDT